jgi:hypothetical protein
MSHSESRVNEVTEMPVTEFETHWRKHYSAVFSGRDIDKGPFCDATWRVFSIGAPLYFHDTYSKPLSAAQRKHIQIYNAIGQSARQLGDQHAVGFLRGGPHLNPSIFYTPNLTARSIHGIRRAALDGFDMHIFSASESWGLAVLWDEEVAVIGGSSKFERILLQAVGGESELRKDFDVFSEYLLTLSAEANEMVSRLRHQAGW